MADKPILFSGPMVRAILDGRKIQTRRVLKFGNRRPDYIGPRGCMDDPSCWGWEMGNGDFWLVQRGEGDHLRSQWTDWAGAYRPGDRLWVREAHALLPRIAYRGSVGTGTIAQVEHPADGYTAAVFREGFDRSGPPPWRPSIHMPRWASRLTLIVTDVRVQRLQDISEGDAVAEGIERMKSGRGFYDATVSKGAVRAGIWHHKATESFQSLWDSLNAGRGYGWDRNPWVAAVSFRAHRCNIDKMDRAAGREGGGE